MLLQRDPTDEELAEKCELPVEKVQKLLELLPQVVSLDEAAGEGEDPLGLLLEDVHAPQPQEELVRNELESIMENLLRQLSPRQQQVLRLRFGMEDGVCYSQEQIGVFLQVSKQRIQQLEKQAIAKLQKLSSGLGLEEFLT